MNNMDPVDHSSAFVLGGDHDDTSIGVQEIPLELISSDDFRLKRFWISVWSIVLQQYTEVEQLVLALYSANRDDRFDRSTYSVNLPPESKVDELMSDQGNGIEQVRDRTDLKYNTGVLVSEEPFDHASLMDGNEQGVSIPDAPPIHF